MASPPRVEPPAPPIEATGGEAPVIPDSGITQTASGRFRILGGNAATRRVFATQAEENQAGYARLLEGNAGKGAPITIQLHDPAVVSPLYASVRESLESVGETFRAVIHIRLDAGATPEACRSAVIRCLLAGDILQGRRPSEVRAGNLVPAWLHRGVMAALDYREQGGRSPVAATVFARGRAFPVEKLLKESPEGMTAAGLAAYDASACGLLLTLLELDKGGGRFRRLLADFASFDAEAATQIRHHFQEMAESDRALEKWWALQVAQMARPGAMDFLSAGESERLLGRALLTELTPTGKTKAETVVLGLPDMIALSDKNERLRVLRQTWLAVRALGPRVHPVFRAVVEAHRVLIEDAMGGKTKELPERLARLDEERATLAARLDAIDDYLNWWEVTKGRGETADLKGYREAMKARPAATRQDDPIGDYLDGAARLLEKP
ncbi:MAG: hypothetical protein ACKO2G_05120 [Verrucomicrobiales bacterium]